MDIKLVVTDLDGTLLDGRHRVSEKNKKAVREAVAAGVTVTIATGRMYVSALPYAEQLEVDVPIITYNGALIKCVSGEVLYERYLEPQTAKELMEFCRARDWHVQSYQDDRLYYAARNEKADDYEKLASIKGIVVGEALYDMTERVPKILIITASSDQSDEYLALLRETFGSRIFATKSNPKYIEIVDPAVNKAAALDILMEKLGVERSAVMAIGDSGNDVPMLRHAGFSVAMANAAEPIRTLCSAVTDDNEHSGVAAAIRKHVLKQ